ncbi:MAG: toxin-antitoxin system, antitoxin component, Xre family protein [Gammaproteobacteria bacterium]
MRTHKQVEQVLIDKIRDLSPEKIDEVTDFVDFLRSRDEGRHLTQVATKLSEQAFNQVWDNPDDADYDHL